MNASGQDGLKSRRLKTIVVATIAFILILVVGVWAITSAVNSGKKKTDGNKTVETAKTEEKKEENNVNPVNPTTENSPSNQYTPTINEQTEVKPQESAPAPAPVASNNIPQTGASEVIFSAIMLGVVASLVTLNVQLAKENRNR